MKPVDVKSNVYLILVKKLLIRIPNLKSVILFEYQNIKNIFAKDYVRDRSE